MYIYWASTKCDRHGDLWVVECSGQWGDCEASRFHEIIKQKENLYCILQASKGIMVTSSPWYPMSSPSTSHPSGFSIIVGSVPCTQWAQQDHTLHTKPNPFLCTFRKFHGSGKHQGCKFSHTESSSSNTVLDSLWWHMHSMRPNDLGGLSSRALCLRAGGCSASLSGPLAWGSS
jgi:hypothetical protein